MSEAPKRVAIADLGGHVGETVEVRGWLYNRRSSGKISFLIVRDGTGIVQGVMVRSEIPDEAWETYDALTQESSLIATGTVREDARAPGGVELTLHAVTTVQIATDYPIGPKEHGSAFLLDHRHLWLRSKRPWHVLRVRDGLILAIREFLHGQGFLCLDSPILTQAVGEEAGTLFETEYFDLGGMHGVWKGVLLRAHVSGREVEDTASPDRVLDARTGDGLVRLGGQHRLAGAVGRPPD
jgi:asparaginyl-tRNA synthetase